jgi:hypothetical protein
LSFLATFKQKVQQGELVEPLLDVINNFRSEIRAAAFAKGEQIQKKQRTICLF